MVRYASSLGWTRKARQSGNKGGERPAQPFVLIGIEMYPIDRACRGDAAGIEEMAAEFGGNVAVGVGQPSRLAGSAGELGGKRPSRVHDRRRSNHQDGGYRHSRFSWRPANASRQRCESLGG